MNSRDFSVQFDLIRDRKSSTGERMSAIQHIHFAIKREYEAGLQSANDINRILEDLENIAHNAINDSDFVYYYCKHFPVSEYFFSQLMERKDACENSHKHLTDAITKNKKLQNNYLITRYSNLLFDSGNLLEALKIVDWSINRSLRNKSDIDNVLYILNRLLKHHCDEVVNFIKSKEMSLIKVFESRYSRDTYHSLDCGIELYSLGFIDLGNYLVKYAHGSARVSTLTRYEKCTGEIITPELATERRYDSIAIISYLVDNPDQIKKFKGKPMPSNGFDLYKFQSYFNSCKTQQDRKSFLCAMVMLAKKWSGSLGDLHGIIHIIITSDPLGNNKRLDGIFKAQAPRYYNDLPKLIKLTDLMSLGGSKVRVNLNDKLLRAELDKLLIGVPLQQLRETISLDPSMKVLDRACIIDAIERNWQGWSEREREELKSKAAPWIVEGASPLQKMRLERDLGM